MCKIKLQIIFVISLQYIICFLYAFLAATNIDRKRRSVIDRFSRIQFVNGNDTYHCYSATGKAFFYIIFSIHIVYSKFVLS